MSEKLMAALVREHRGLLADSMATVRAVSDRAELVRIIQDDYRRFSIDVQPEQIHIEPYCYDSRIDWDTYIIRVERQGVWGMSKGPLDE